MRAEVPSHLAKPSGQEPRWGELKSFFAKLDISIETDEVKRVRDLRHLLTHQRGALRTEVSRAKFAGAVSSYSFESLIVDLSEDVVVQAMDALAAAVRRVDALVWQLRN